MGKMDSKSYVPLTVISKFPKIESHLPKGAQLDALEAVCEGSEYLQFEIRSTVPCVRRRPQEAQRGTTDPGVWAQQFWSELTSPVYTPDETIYTVEDLTKLEQFSSQQDSFVSTFGYFEEDASNGFCGVLSSAEVRMRYVNTSYSCSILLFQKQTKQNTVTRNQRPRRGNHLLQRRDVRKLMKILGLTSLPNVEMSCRT